MSYDIEVYKHTVDDWYPNFERDLVMVRMLPDSSYGNAYRVCVWGADDCGREKLYMTEALALTEFMQIIGQESVSNVDLDSRGFIAA